jgi:hypothetical protein
MSRFTFMQEIRSMTRLASRSLPAMLIALTLAACGSNEPPPEEGHTPANAALFVGDVNVSAALVLPAGETVRVEVRFLDDQGDVITGIEGDHHTKLTFTPAALATTASVDGQNFQKDVTAQADPATGTLTVGYGHDEAADELEFAPYDVTVVATGASR